MVIRNGAQRYQQVSENRVSARETENAAFNLVTRELEASTGHAERLRALGRNHALWSILVKDLSLTENRMPDTVKTELIGLGLWAMRYSTLALLKALSVEPLVAVNRNILDGLLAQATPHAEATSKPSAATQIA